MKSANLLHEWGLSDFQSQSIIKSEQKRVHNPKTWLLGKIHNYDQANLLET